MERAKGRRAFSIGGVIGRTFSVWLRNIVPFTLLAVIVYSPLFIYTVILAQGGLTEAEEAKRDLVVTLGPYILNSILAGLIAYGVFRHLNGKPAGLFECMGKGLRQVVPVVLTGIVVGVLTLIGLKLFVVPGIIFSCMWWVAVPVAVVERTGVFKAMSRSYTLTRGEKGSVFLVLLFLVALLFGALTLMGRLAAHIDNATVLNWVAVGILVVFSILQAVAAAVGYHDLRVSKEGASVEELVAVFA